MGSVATSLTGKNPFAILKASAIASSQTAQFPNNFTNLPKVQPPFLPPLEGDTKASTYTLVLDLDETLIHNVEVPSLLKLLVRRRQLLPGAAGLRLLYRADGQVLRDRDLHCGAARLRGPGHRPDRREQEHQVQALQTAHLAQRALPSEGPEPAGQGPGPSHNHRQHLGQLHNSAGQRHFLFDVVRRHERQLLGGYFALADRNRREEAARRQEGPQSVSRSNSEADFEWSHARRPALNSV